MVDKRSAIRGLFLASIFFVLAPANADDFNIQVTVTGVEPEKGQILAALYDSSDSWMKTPVAQVVGPPNAGTTVVLEFKGYSPGDYGVAVVYDKNKDGKLDTGLFGIPTEKVGFSNDAPIEFGPAHWKKAMFTLASADLAIQIDLKSQDKSDYKQ